MIGQSFLAAFVGALTGVAVAHGCSLRTLAGENEDLREQLTQLGKRFERGTIVVHERPVSVGQARPSSSAPPLTPREAANYGPPAGIAPPSVERVAERAGAVGDSRRDVREPVDARVAAIAAPPRLRDRLPVESPVTATAIEASARVEPWPAPASETPPAEPPSDSPAGSGREDRAFTAAREWLLGGNTVLRIGVVLLFLGLAFLLRYAAERVVIPLELRYAGVALVGLGLLALGWLLRRRRPEYGLILQGTGVATLYLTIFAAMRLHPLIDPKAGFLLLLATTVGSALLAVKQNARALAIAAALGGFAAPILASTGSGNHVALFSYFVLLDAGILAIAWFKAWRLLNLIGFVGTFGIGLAWGLRSYTPALFASTEPFLALFFLMYVTIGLLFAGRKLRETAGAPAGAERDAVLRWSARQADAIDGIVMFGPPVVGFGLQLAVVAHIESGAAFSALALGLFYLGLARSLVRRRAGALLLLVETYVALGVVFATLAIPLGFDAGWTAHAWAVEGAGIFWLGVRQQRRSARIFALSLQLGAALMFVGELGPGSVTLLAGPPLGALTLGVALLVTHHLLRRAAPTVAAWESALAPVLALAGLVSLFTIAPLCFAVDGTAIGWAIAGVATMFAGLRLHSRSYLIAAFAVQLLGGALFLAHLQGSPSATGGVLLAGWRGSLNASLIGLMLVANALMTAHDPLIRGDRRLAFGLTVVFLLGLACVNLAVLFVLPWQIASAVWGASGLAIVWLSLLLQRRAGLVFGLVLQAIGGLVFLMCGPPVFGPAAGDGLRPLAHIGFWTPAVLAVAALIGAGKLHRATTSPRSPRMTSLGLATLSQLLLIWGAGWWTLTALGEIDRFVPASAREHAALLAAAGSVALWTQIALRERWRAMGSLCLALTPAAALALALVYQPTYHPAAHLGLAGWSAVVVVHLLSLRQLSGLLPQRVLGAAHVLGSGLVLAILTVELRFLVSAVTGAESAWRWLGWAPVPCAFLWLVGGGRRLCWPFSAYPRAYHGVAGCLVAGLLLAWFWLTNAVSDGSAAPLPYLPLVNPLELGLLITLATVVRWWRRVPSRLGVEVHTSYRHWALGSSLFALLTAAVGRTAHHWGGLPYRLDALLASMSVQAGLSLLWTLIALGMMIAGHRHRHRASWTIGSILIGVVVVKLFFVDLGNHGSLARVISFTGVGILLLIVGYFAPLPPRQPGAGPEAVRE
ncbi:DUF2339 domain-containing protein [Nannocystis punicea]|uniref:DUF2339 domain-containing protein n=1 Tax=Nannocystis punicea TaxID=2995304 RepID=A0ABY7GX70_9BACT|nr:DUF2339 domain-containing protein [Nannocystis poenicansa]WAS91546.1 DUF2339 domain-containing protein [Nannocystis poenicansa]